LSVAVLQFLIIGAAALAVLMLTGVRVLKEYERGVIFRLGRARRNLAGPGIVLMLPMGIDRARVVDTRIRVVQIPPQEVITHDNISIVVDAVVYTTVESVAHAILEVEEYIPATLQLAATTLRTVIGRMDLDDILAHREEINDEVRNLLDERTEQWGVTISAVELKDIELPQEMKRAMARQAEAERERRAKVIAAEGEQQAAKQLAAAAGILAEHPGAMQLRLYQSMIEMSGDASSKIIIPLPIELLTGMQKTGAISPEQITQLVKAAVEAGETKKSLGAGAPKPSLAAAPKAPSLKAGGDSGEPS
jgi:regulator of protease activity HflC (stomatin/prohibitin superfamily)